MRTIAQLHVRIQETGGQSIVTGVLKDMDGTNSSPWSTSWWCKWYLKENWLYFELQPKHPNMQALAYMHTVDSCDSNAVYSPGSSPTPYVSIVLQRLSCW